MLREGFRGQSAIEYLMTYGWMLLVVAIAGGTIFAVTGDQSVESSSGFVGEDVRLDDFGLNSASNLELILRNGASQKVKVNSVNLTEGDKFSEWIGSEEIDVSETGNIEIANITDSEDTNDLNLEINYDVGGLSNLEVSGTISGNFEINESGSSAGDLDGGVDELSRPSASISVNNSVPEAGKTIEFNASSSTSDNSITDYNWNFGDGNTDIGEVVTHSYNSEGNYTVELTLTDSNGQTANETVEIEVKSPLADSALYHYSFDEGNLTNQWGSTPSLTNNGASLTSNGRFDDAYSIAGSQTSRLESNNGFPKLENKREITVTAWVNPDTTNQPQDFSFVVSFANQVTGSNSERDNEGLAISFDGYSTKARFRSPHGRASSSDEIPADQYTLITGVFDDLSGETKIYYNGSNLQASITGSGSTQTEFNHMWIGDSAHTSNDDTFDGIIDEIKIYDKALNESEINSIYSNGDL